MKLLVIGHCALDIRHLADGTESEAYGGVLNAARSLSALMERSDRVVPVCGVHKSEMPPLLEHLRAMPCVDISGIFACETPMHRVHAVDRGTGVRFECAEVPAGPIPFERIRKHLDCDGILINMVSGFDLTLETLDEIRMAVRGQGITIHFDFHNLTLGIRGNHERFRRPVPEWRRWAFMVDTLQLNEEEIAGLSVEQLSESQTAGHLLTLGVQGVVVTRAERGVTLYRNEHKRLVREDVPAVSGPGAEDSIGRGDTLGAAFLLAVVRRASLIEAARYAVRVAGGYTERFQEGHAHVTPG